MRNRSRPKTVWGVGHTLVFPWIWWCYVSVDVSHWSLSLILCFPLFVFFSVLLFTGLSFGHHSISWLRYAWSLLYLDRALPAFRARCPHPTVLTTPTGLNTVGHLVVASFGRGPRSRTPPAARNSHPHSGEQPPGSSLVIEDRQSVTLCIIDTSSHPLNPINRQRWGNMRYNWIALAGILLVLKPIKSYRIHTPLRWLQFFRMQC